MCEPQEIGVLELAFVLEFVNDLVFLSALCVMFGVSVALCVMFGVSVCSVCHVWCFCLLCVSCLVFLLLCV
jgi:hypothetical protein